MGSSAHGFPLFLSLICSARSPVYSYVSGNSQIKYRLPFHRKPVLCISNKFSVNQKAGFLKPAFKMLCNCILSCNDVNRYVEDLRNLKDRIDMSSCCSRKVMCRATLAPAVYELSCAAGKTCSHLGIAEGQDRAFLVYALRHDELEVSVAVLSDCK